MIPVRETMAGQIRWGCTNPWHPRDPGPCPGCDYSGRPHTAEVSANPMARCPKCHHQWLPIEA
jgi:hypothetical protein